MTNHPLGPAALTKSIVLVGMMGAGKSTVGRLLAHRLRLPFVDSDHEIEAAAALSVSQIFETLGEPAFRDAERRVIARLLDGPLCILSTGGGAFMNEQTRAVIKEKALSVWLQAEFDVLLERVSRTNNRPLLQKGDPAILLRELMQTREPLYAQADLTVTSDQRPLETTVDRLIALIEEKDR